jgi:enoyl-CoA hydratase
MAIKVELVGKALVVTLDRSHRYNATDINTINALHELLDQYAQNNAVERMLITSDHPKAFCAGGDVRAVYELIQHNNFAEAKNFFDREYSLIAKMASYQKPIISLVNGMCFGGGMGLSMHNRYRIITENAIMAMPETIIGFFPDVGASFRFAKLSKGWRNFYALTGYAIPLGLALKNDFADFFVKSQNLADLQQTLCECDSGAEKQTIAEFAEIFSKNHETDEDWIERTFNQFLPEIFLSLEKSTHKRAATILKDLTHRSPLSLRVTYQLMEMGEQFSLEDSLKLDQIIANNFINFKDFTEGVRAQVVDKDKNPTWVYKTIADIPQELVSAIFQPN